MFLAYTYKLKPSPSQAQIMTHWLDMLRALYNFNLRDRIEAYEQVKAPVLGNYCRLDTQADCCPLTCSISKNATIGYPWRANGTRRSACEQQQSNLIELKSSRPWYKKIYSSVLQGALEQLDNAFKNFFKEKKGYPRFKSKSKFRSFSYKPNQVKIEGRRIYLPKIGWMPFYLSRPIPDGFSIRTVTVKKKATGWFVSIRLEDKSIPAIPKIEKSQIKTGIGCDLGINKLVSLSNEETIPNPKFYKQVERRRKIRARRASRKVKGSKNRTKAYQYLAKLEAKVAEKRNNYQWKTAHKICKSGELVAFEDLNIKGMMARCKPKKDENGKYIKNGQSKKKGLSRVIGDAGWGQLKQKVRTVAEKLGLYYVEVDPKHTSQTCNNCGCVDAANRLGEKFVCTDCGWIEDADTQASKNILDRGLKILSISLPKLPMVNRKVTTKESRESRETSMGLPVEPSNPQYKQLCLFNWEDVCIGNGTKPESHVL